MGVENRKELIAARLGSFDPSSVTVEKGQEIFAKNCSMCHKIGNNPGGADRSTTRSGIGTWGAKCTGRKDPRS